MTDIISFSKENTLFTTVTVVVHQDDLLEQVSWRVVDDAVDGSQYHRKGFVHKDEDHGDLWKVLRVRQLLTPVRTEWRLLACNNKGCEDELKKQRTKFNNTRK